jgi:hypothetical protein
MPYFHPCSKDLILVDPDDEIEIAAVLSLRCACISCYESGCCACHDARHDDQHLLAAGVETWGTFAMCLMTQHWTKCFCSFLPGAAAARTYVKQSRWHSHLPTKVACDRQAFSAAN